MLRRRTKKRWNIAQEYEKDYWDCSWKPKESKQRKYLVAEYWNLYLSSLKAYAEFKEESRILEIGCGADGIINYISKGEKTAIDPLMDYYTSNFTMSKEVKWVSGVGEDIHFEDEHFDIVVTTNTLDHTHDPNRVLSEIRRVLKRQGVLFLTVNCHRLFPKYYNSMKELFGRGETTHLYIFSVKDVKNLIKKSGLQMLFIQKGVGDISEYIWEKLPDSSPKLPAKELRLFKKSLNILKGKGFIALIDIGIVKLSRWLGRKLTKEEPRLDFMFIARKGD